MPLPRVVVLTASPDLVRQVENWLAARATVFSAVNTDEADEYLAKAPAEVLVCHDNLPGEPGLMFLARHTNDTPWTRRILICSPLEPGLFLHVINEARVFRCAIEPYSPSDLRRQIETALDEAVASRGVFDAARRGDRPSRLIMAWTRALPRLAMLAAVTWTGILLVGTLTLILLYTLKVFFGIDIFADGHLSDIWK